LLLQLFNFYVQAKKKKKQCSGTKQQLKNIGRLRGYIL
jgi:hypothetical protein